MKAAFYCGTRKGINGLYSKGVRYIEEGDFSHCELVFSDGVSASASFIDGGVRYKDIKYTSGDWVFVDVSWADEKKAREYFDKHEGYGYDVSGNIHFLFGVVGDSEDKKFCSEAVAEALGIDSAWLLAPNALYHVLIFINKQIERQKEMNALNFVADTDSDDDTSETGHGDVPPKKPPVVPVGG
jgi:hypothetical protein